MSPVRQRLDVAANRRQRRAQLVRDVGDEVAADLIGAPQIGDVVEHEDHAVRRRPRISRDRRGPRREGPRRVARRRQLDRVRGLSAERRAHEIGDRRMPDGLDVVAADRQRVELQHLRGRFVHDLQPSLRIDDDDPFDHAGEDGAHAAAIARQVADSRAEILDRFVERPRHRPELVVAEVERGGRQVAAAVAPRLFGDGARRGGPAGAS